MISIQGLCKHEEDRTAVGPLDLVVQPGQVMVLLGPLGSGNSLIMRLLATLAQPSSGTATIAGHDLRREPTAIRQSIGYLPDLPGSYGDMRVEEYLTFFAQAYHLEAADTRRRDRLLREVGLAQQLEQFCGALDREGCQRLGLVKCLLHEPPVLLLDKPAAGLDLPARRRLLELIGRLARQGSAPRTVLLATNLLGDALAVADRIAVMAHGRLLREGTPAEIAAWLGPLRLYELELAENGAAETEPAEQLLQRLRRDPAIARCDAHRRYVIFGLRDPLADGLDTIARLLDEGVPITGYREHEIDPWDAPVASGLPPHPASPTA